MVFLFFFFKQKTAYEMRISDWSSDVCSSDLVDQPEIVGNGDPQPDDARALDPGIVEHPAHRTAIEIADMARQREIDLFGNARERLPRETDEHPRDAVAIDVAADRGAGAALVEELGERRGGGVGKGGDVRVDLGGGVDRK